MINHEQHTQISIPVAAVDLGSNSFHMIVAKEVSGHIHVLDRLREMVQLGAGLNEKGRLKKSVQERALDCLKRFGQRVREIPLGRVRAVGTNTLRELRNSEEFLTLAQKALGHPIEIISGHEEARLIYLGVSHSTGDRGGKRLVMDIGGGSTEFIIGEKFEPQSLESLHLGCLSITRSYFAKGKLNKNAFEEAILTARRRLQPIERQFKLIGWQAAIGSSGSLLAIAQLLRENRITDGTITLAGLHQLKQIFLLAGDIDKLPFVNLSTQRLQTLPGGLVITLAAFESLEITEMSVSEGALREGLLNDLLGRIHHEDVRQRTINALLTRYQVSPRQSTRVAEAARALLESVATDWEFDLEEDAAMLDWAAKLHEIGLAISHHKFHHHSAYLIKHSDLPGFTWQEQELLSALVLAHRRRFPLDLFGESPLNRNKNAIKLAVLLRLAVLFHRGHYDHALPLFAFRAETDTLYLEFPPGWLDQHPLTVADLNEENRYLKPLGIYIQFS